MKRNYLFFWFAALLLLFSPAQSYAEVYSGSCGESVNWSLDTETGLLEITGSGEMEDYEDYDDPWYSHRSSINKCTIGNGVTSIGKYAFSHCNELTSITIPNSVTSIGDYAFYWCTRLTNITIPESVTSIGGHAFSHCDGLTSITIPEGVTSIGGHAFYGCTGLTSITIPESVTSIGSYAFLGCTGLTSITWNAISCTSFSSRTFDGIKENITSFTFGGKVQTIPAEICSGMSNLTSITIPESVTSIEDWAFRGCTGLTSITIPNSVTSIGDYAFNKCTGLTGVIMGKGVTSIGKSAYANNSNLVSITCYSQTSPEAGGFAFYGISSEAILYYPKGSDYSAWAPYFAQMIEMDETDIDTPRANDSKNHTYDIYDMSGRTVRKAATTTDGLKAGLYIINGRKVLVE